MLAGSPSPSNDFFPVFGMGPFTLLGGIIVLLLFVLILIDFIIPSPNSEPSPEKDETENLPSYEKCNNCGQKGGYKIWRCENHHICCDQCRSTTCPICGSWNIEAIGRSGY